MLHISAKASIYSCWTFGAVKMNVFAKDKKANLSLYHRKSVTASPEKIAEGEEIKDHELMEEGEFFLVFHTDELKEEIIKYKVHFSDASKVMNIPLRPAKIAHSWLPANCFELMKKAGLKKVSDLYHKPHKDALQKAGLGAHAINELMQLSYLLDLPTLDYQAAATLYRGGIRKPTDFLKLNSTQKGEWVSIIGTNVLLDPTDPNIPCTHVGSVSGLPDDTITDPLVDWTWYGPTPDANHIIDTRPWWGSPDNVVTEGAALQDQEYWYPDSKQGWKVFGYQFGGTGGQIGYLLTYNIYTGIIRLFVYLPNVEQRFFNKLLGTVSIIDPDRNVTSTWSFPLMDVPPQDRSFEAGDVVDGDTPPALQAVPSSYSLTWPGSTVAFHDLSVAAAFGNGKWLRTELMTLYDPALYPSTQPVRPLRGCMGIFFPSSEPVPTGIQEQDRRLLQLRFEGMLEGQTQLSVDLDLELSGKAVSTAQPHQPGFLGYVKNMFSYSNQAGSGASKVLDFIKDHTSLIADGASWPGAVINVAKVAGGIFGLLETKATKPPEFRINLTGAIIGELKGKTFFIIPGSVFEINLNDTFIATNNMTQDGPDYFPTGWPQTYQRCNSVRFGIIGFKPPGANDPGVFGIDPRPQTINVEWIPVDEFGSAYRPLAHVSEIGSFQAAPWADIDIVDQKAELEIIKYNNEPPHEITKLCSLTPAGTTIDFIPDVHFAHLFDKEKLCIRWSCRIVPRNPNASPFEFHYALDLKEKTIILIDQAPGTGDPPDDDW